eukprot:TRINITY_DN1527_c1_g3_i1.p1 TRINITY_DN1527_c1_g3~~TRINITY_DN1527_c1_g3_i1.p1  ORF type:complete len:345 (+),score=102.27 TRINITY_DN1527_c1_g3_i1:41-1036(+)
MGCGSSAQRSNEKPCGARPPPAADAAEADAGTGDPPASGPAAGVAAPGAGAGPAGDAREASGSGAASEATGGGVDDTDTDAGRSAAPPADDAPPADTAPSAGAARAAAASPGKATVVERTADGACPTAPSGAVRLVCVSDTHTMHDALPPLPPGDVLVHCGDFTNSGTVEEVESFARWLAAQPHPVRVVVRGNHECRPWAKVRADLTPVADVPGVTVLGNAEFKELAGVTFLGMPWGSYTPDGFRRCDVLLSHAPPQGVLDAGGGFGPCGDEEVGSLVRSARPRLHCFGHSHQSRGTLDLGATLYVNCACAEPSQAPASLVGGAFVVDLPV